MSKYIDAEKLIAEIEWLKERYGSITPKSITAQNYQEGRLIGYEDALYKIKKSLQQVQPEVDLETASRNVYESWMGGTMDDVRRDMVELGKVLNARKEK